MNVVREVLCCSLSSNIAACQYKCSVPSRLRQLQLQNRNLFGAEKGAVIQQVAHRHLQMELNLHRAACTEQLAQRNLRRATCTGGYGFRACAWSVFPPPPCYLPVLRSRRRIGSTSPQTCRCPWSSGPPRTPPCPPAFLGFKA